MVPDKPLLSPQDYAGLHVRAGPSDVTYQLIDALGAMPMFADGGYKAAESGLLQGGTLTGKPVATGNVIFFPKFQVIFANGDVFNTLNLIATSNRLGDPKFWIGVLPTKLTLPSTVLISAGERQLALYHTPKRGTNLK